MKLSKLFLSVLILSPVTCNIIASSKEKEKTVTSKEIKLADAKKLKAEITTDHMLQITRYKADGALDDDFGTGGLTGISDPKYSGFASISLIIDHLKNQKEPSGNFTIEGSRLNGSKFNVTFNADGTINLQETSQDNLG